MVISYMINQTMKVFRTKWKDRAYLAITGGIQGTSRKPIYDELGLPSLVKSDWRNKLGFFYKIINRLLPDYLHCYRDFSSQENYILRSSSTSIIRPVLTRTKSFKRTFFPCCIMNGINLKLVLGMLNQLTFLKNLL